MGIKRIVLSTFMDGIRVLKCAKIFDNFGFELTDEYDFLLGIRCKDGQVEMTDVLEEIVSDCAIILMCDGYNDESIIKELADGNTGLIYHTNTHPIQRDYFHDISYQSVHDLNSYDDSFAYIYNILKQGKEATKNDLDKILALFNKRVG